MDLGTLEISREEAAERLAAYEQLIGEQRTAEDQAIAAGYRAAARGLPVISLTNTIRAGGLFDNGWPRIAIINADATTCWVRRTDTWRAGEPGFTFSNKENVDNRGALVGGSTVRVPWDHNGTPLPKTWSAKTIVPIVPPEHRPKTRRRLGRLHVLWEVEAWDLTAPKDPALLRHIRGDLWAVLAIWDLTALERAVLAQRAE